MKAIFVSVEQQLYIWKKIVKHLSSSGPASRVVDGRFEASMSKSDFFMRKSPDSSWTIDVLAKDVIKEPFDNLYVVINLSLTHRDSDLIAIASPKPQCMVHKSDDGRFESIRKFFGNCEITKYSTGTGDDSDVWAGFLKEVGMPEGPGLHAALHDFKSSVSWLVLSLKTDPTGDRARALAAEYGVEKLIKSVTTAESRLIGLANAHLSAKERDSLKRQSKEVLDGVKLCMTDPEAETEDLVARIENWLSLYQRLVLSEP